MDDTARYLRQTLRAAAVLALAAVAVLLNLGLGWAIAPLLTGLALAIALLLGWHGFVRSLIGAGQGREKSQRDRRARTRFVVFALVKYPLVGFLIWFLTRIWDARSLGVFLAGFILLHVVITLRAIGRLLTEERQA
jgi:hypothetical protein